MWRLEPVFNPTVLACFQDTDTLWLDYHQNITDKSMRCMDAYLVQFPDIKVRWFVRIESNVS